MAQDIQYRDVDDNTLPATDATVVENDNSGIGSAKMPIAIGDPLAPGQISMAELMEYIFDNIATWIAAGSNVSISSQKSGGTYTLTIASTDTDTNTQLDAAGVYTHVSNFISAANSSMTITEDSTNQTITFGTKTGEWIHNTTVNETTSGDDWTTQSVDPNFSNTMRRFTIVGQIQVDLDAGSGGDFWTTCSNSYPGNRFLTNGQRIQCIGADGSFAVCQRLSNNTQMRIYVKDADGSESNPQFRYLGLWVDYV